MSDRRGVSTALSYVIGLAIAFVLVTGLLMAGGDFVETQREESVRIELRVLGQQVASELSQADRLASTTTDNETVRVRRNLPGTVAGSPYHIAVEGGTDPYVEMEAVAADVTVRANITNETDVAMTRINGGAIAVNYTDGELVLEGQR